MVYHIIDYLIGLFTGIFAGYGMRIIDERRKKPTKSDSPKIEYIYRKF